MRKVKNVLLILLAVLLLAAGGLLPMAAAQLQDEATANVVQYADIEALRLKLEEEQPEMSIYEKLRLMMKGTGVEATSEMTKMTGSQILEAVYAALQPYVDVGFLTDDLSNDYLEYYPIMVYDQDAPSVYNYYWQVHMSLDAYQYDSLRVILDDETGKLLAIEVTNPELIIAEEYQDKLEQAIRVVYLENLGLTPVAVIPVETEGAYIGEIWEPDSTHVLMRYQCVDVNYGEVNVEVGVNSNGFYIFPV